MSDAAPQSDLLMFGELLAHLRQHGFSVGIDHYLRLQRLLDKVGGLCAPRELRTLLCPILATSKTQQEHFYRAFDSYFSLYEAPDESVGDEEPLSEGIGDGPAARAPGRARTKKWLYVAAIAAVAVAFALFLLLRQRQAEQPQAAPAPESASASPEPSVTAQPAPAAVADTPTPAGAAVSASPTPTPAQSFYEKHRVLIQLAVILAPLLLFLFFEWYRLARRKLLLQRQQTRKPPFVWPIQVEAPEGGVYDSEQFMTAARLLRRRQVDEFRRLDVEATVAATVERLGFPAFRYKSDSRVPEYLVLIDRASFRDHQARLFDELARALEREGVFVVRYFFDRDPRVCRDEGGAISVQLTELQNRFGDHRLIIFGGGEGLLDQLTGRPEGWTVIFSHWRDRALLTPEGPARWGLREVTLAKNFIVLPATLKGLLALVDYFETTVPEDLRSWLRAGDSGDDDAPAPEDAPEETVRRLRRYLGEDAFQWLCACAVYTELQWNLTLHIGSLPSMPPGLVTEANLLKLIRLPWFRTGVIPDELRWPLINGLSPERQQAVRAAIIELLEKDPAPPESVASDQYHLNLFAQRWLHGRTRKRLRELMALMKRLPRSHVVRDLTLIRFLESARRSPLDILLPQSMRKALYHRGVPAFGLKTGARFVLTLFFATGLWLSISLLVPDASLTRAEPSEAASAQPTSDEGKPAALVRTSTGKFFWVDKDGVQLRALLPSDTFPPFFARGLDENDTEAARASNRERIQKYLEMKREWESLGLSERVSEVNLSDLRDVRVNLAEDEVHIEVILGEKNFGRRLYNALKVLDEKRAEPIGPFIIRLIASQDESVSIGLAPSAPGEQVPIDNQGQPTVAKGEKQKPAGEATGQTTPIVVLGANKTAPALPGTPRSGAATESSVVSLPPVGGEVTGKGQITDNDKEPPPPMTQAGPTQKPAVINSVGVLNGRAKSLPKPLYPQAAAAVGAAGPVQVMVVLDETGKVISARATSGHPALHRAAEEAAFKARFAPQLINGQPTKVQGYINYNFVIERPQPPDDMRPEGQRPPRPGPGRRPG